MAWLKGSFSQRKNIAPTEYKIPPAKSSENHVQLDFHKSGLMATIMSQPIMM